MSASIPLVSVVTVVHNGERHLRECMESVLAQTYGHWEYRVIDNCSSDSTGAIATTLADRDERVRYERHEEFVGVVQSHNRGFDSVSGSSSTYCKFVGADDWLYPECLERMVEVAESDSEIGVVGSYRLNGRNVDLVNLPYTKRRLPGRELVARGLTSPFSVTGSPTALMLRSAIVRDRRPFYDESFRLADAEAHYWALMRSDYGFVHQVLTYNREHPSPETSVSDRLAAYTPERIRMLIRYGPSVLPQSEYCALLRDRLSEYVSWSRRQFVWRQTKGRLGRFRARDEIREAERRDFHRSQIGLIAQEAGVDRDVVRAVRVLRKLW